MSVANSCSWSFLQALNNNFHCAKEQDTEKAEVYVHPLVKRSSSRLSEKSLQMCTESLCNETGSAVTEIDNDEIKLLSLGSTENGPVKQARKSDGFPVPKKLNHCRGFPPPLSTSISGSSTGHVQVKPHREGGRLVLKAVTVLPSCHGLFHAERGEGRLRLRMVQEEGTVEEEEDEEVVQEQVETEVGEEEAEEAGVGDDADGDENDEQACWGEEEEEEGNRGSGGGDARGIRKLPRPSRCTEGGLGNKVLLNWEPFLVPPYKLSA